MGHQLDPALLARIDQERAETMATVARAVAYYREHLAEHAENGDHGGQLGGGEICGWALVARQLLYDAPIPYRLADLVAGCVNRITQLEDQLADNDAALAELKRRVGA